jgi:hypothetical protein
MVNNVIDHSASPLARVKVFRTIGQIDLQVIDEGIGIFKKVADSCNLPDEREAILELAKGKLTTDPSRHTGEGIFFTSRMFDTFEIASGRLHFVHYQPDNDWLQQDDRGRAIKGTFIRMVISSRSTRHPRDVFGKYASSPEEATFSKTHVPISLAQYGTDSLVSRSQARRVLSRFERFEEVFLDFSGVEFIGQAFADEMFRVYRNDHPNVRLVATNANDDVNGMIQHVTQNGQDSAMKQGTDFYTETSTPLLPNEFIIDSTE